MDFQAINSAYKRYLPRCNSTFGKLLMPSRKLAVDIINRATPHRAKVLEVGVGVGFSLPFYRSDLSIVGIDVCRGRLKQAQQTLAQQKCVHRHYELLEMNVENLVFNDNYFNSVIVMYTQVSVPNWDKMLAQIRRVCVPDAEIIILNHVTLSYFILKLMENKLSKVEKLVDAKSNFPLDQILNYPHFKLLHAYKTSVLRYWALLHLKNNIKPNTVIS